MNVLLSVTRPARITKQTRRERKRKRDDDDDDDDDEYCGSNMSKHLGG